MKALMLALLVAVPALAADPTAEELLLRYDETMGPSTFEAESQMTAWREDGSSRGYEMRMLKGQDDKSRIWFKSPASVKGQEVLRSGDNVWVYLPNLKRATRVANRDSFQGGDFNNADILRVGYAKDYAAKLVASDVPDTWALELKAKSPETAYDAIKLWLRKSDGLPVKGQYFGTSGQMLRSAEFSEYTEFEKGYTRPAKVVMRNELVKSRRSELVLKSLKRGVEAPPQRFTQADLGR
ncbi:outer membrane lipoprotein-sorting protein [Hyalangium rubrum]|uniref:Outer membrane lipoprotein-sorting protein n=1 Tax=Hyalangium rubrum TaxID=3103134 RepID=A0ABU5H3W4_9BACT|nr:outer membrane lipoprotein-sorting protein [Hyalangium sp. s54d21]MDY7226780.1 outer membrane lipoprotein-sorting protein [Hyalangium sp. s54d21]